MASVSNIIVLVKDCVFTADLVFAIAALFAGVAAGNNCERDAGSQDARNNDHRS